MSANTALERVRPPLKWLGGKFTLLDEIIPHLGPVDGATEGRFVEPFVGAANVAMNAPFRRLVLADANPDLPNFYTVARSFPDEFDALIAELFVPENNTLERYLGFRVEFNSMVGSFDPKVGDVRRAGLFAYLNRHCFNGLCRYNQSGGFNAHFGSYKNPQWPVEAMSHLRERLRYAHIVCADWRDTFDLAAPGDVIYCDPPYLETFSDYAKGGFGLKDHEDLADRAYALAERGVRVLISNSLEAAPLYADAGMFRLEAMRRVSRTVAGRGKRTELLAVFEAKPIETVEAA